MTLHGFLSRGLEPATGAGPLGRIDPAVASLITVGLALSSATIPLADSVPLALHAVVALLLVLLSGRAIPLALRLAFVTPFMGGLLLMAPFHPDGVSTGIVIALWAMARGMVAALFLLTLTAVHPLPSILNGMVRLHVPTTLVMVAGMTFRYLTTLADEGLAMRQAATLRGYGARTVWGSGAMGRLIGALFIRSYERAERVHRAMLLRGWEGTPGNEGAPLGLRLLLPVALTLAAILVMRRVG